MDWAKPPGEEPGPKRRGSDHGPDLNRGSDAHTDRKVGGSSAIMEAVSVPVFEALLFQHVRAFFQDLPRRVFRLKWPGKFLTLQAIEEMKSGQEPIVALISMLANKNTDGIPLKFYDISVRH